MERRTVMIATKWTLQLVCIAVLTGCFYGGGPVVGYGQRGGWFGGGEVTTGFVVGSVSAGYQSDGVSFVHGDLEATANRGSPQESTVGLAMPSGRLGIGFEGSRMGGVGGMFVVGGGVATGLAYPEVGYQSGECNDKWATELVTTIELRYVGQVEVVLVPRLERRNIFCGGS